MGFINFGSLAQLVEQRTFNPFVVRSIRTRPTILFLVISLSISGLSLAMCAISAFSREVKFNDEI
jgi:hypothetical protein